VEVERLLLLRVEELQDLYQNLADLGVEFDVVLGLLADLLGEQLQTVLYLLVALGLEPLLHAV